VGLVPFGGVPATVPDQFIDEPQRRFAQSAPAEGAQLNGLEQGARIMITSGPFAGYEAVFDAHFCAEPRIRVLGLSDEE